MSTESELIENVSKLLDMTADLEVLGDIQKLVSDRIDHVSNHSKTDSVKDDSVPNNDNVINSEQVAEHTAEPDATRIRSSLNDHVQYLQSLDFLSKDFQQHISDDVIKLCRVTNRSSTVQYRWLFNGPISYCFGGRTYKPIKISDYPAINDLMERLNTEFDCTLDSCLLSFYGSTEVVVPPHCDDEVVIDQGHFICNVSLGSSRVINFYNKSDIKTPIVTQEMVDGSVLLMLPGCQGLYKHGVEPGVSDGTEQSRCCLSFRKVNKPTVSLPTETGYQADQSDQDHASEMRHHNLDFQRKPKITNVDTYPGANHHNPEFQRKPRISNSNVEVYTGEGHFEHLIIGDSLTRDINLRKCITITKGGCRVDQLFDVLKGCKYFTEPEYQNFKTITVCVGTNSVNKVNIPFLTILKDYDTLINKLSSTFPTAKIGMLNILPRAYKHFPQLARIKAFNNCLFDFQEQYQQVQVVNLFWEFITHDGFLDQKLYQEDCLHLRERGKDMLRRRVDVFHGNFLKSRASDSFYYV